MKLAALIGFAGGAALLWLFARSISAVDRRDALALADTDHTHYLESLTRDYVAGIVYRDLYSEAAIRAAGVH